MKALLCTVPLGVGTLVRGVAQLPMVPKLAIVSLIDWMQRNGYKPDEYDFYDIDMLDPSDEQLRAYFKRCNPTVVGLSAVVSTSYLQVKRISRILRETCPDAWIVMGGYLAASYDVILRKTDVDLVVEGDGEIAWIQFLDYVKKHGRERHYGELQRIVGMVYLKDGKTNPHCGGLQLPANDMAFPDYDILALGLKTQPEALQHYFRPGIEAEWFNHSPRAHEKTRKPNIAMLWTSKGCVAQCTFCQRGTDGYRLYSLETMDKHLAMLRDRFDVGYIMLADENFGSAKKYAYDMARLMVKHDMLWVGGGVRCTSVTDADAKFYYEHGCTGIKLGVESGSQKILDLMEKKFTVARVRSAVDSCLDNKLLAPLAVMTGYPGETDELVKQTSELIAKVAVKKGVPPAQCGVEIFYAMPLPDTPLYEYGKTTGMIGEDPDGEEEYLISVSDRGVEKMNYLNLNGATVKNLLYWDVLLRLEASRIYYRLVGENSDKRAESTEAPEAEPPKLSKSFSELAYHYGGKLTKPRPVVRAWMMMRRKTLSWFVSSPFVARLPSGPVDWAGRNVVYAAFLTEKWVLRCRRFLGLTPRDAQLPMLFEDQPPPVAPLTDAELTALGGGVIRSLRNVVLKRRGKLAPTPTSAVPSVREPTAA